MAHNVKTSKTKTVGSKVHCTNRYVGLANPAERNAATSTTANRAFVENRNTVTDLRALVILPARYQ